MSEILPYSVMILTINQENKVDSEMCQPQGTTLCRAHVNPWGTVES